MSALTNWQAAFADPRFWANRYALDESSVSLFDISLDECDAYYHHLIGNDDLPGFIDEPSLTEQGSIFTLPFPENFLWKMHITSEGIFHTLFHPKYSPDGALLAEESGSPQLPGLRWSELKQIDACLQQSWKELFDRPIVLPLLYPVVTWVTFDELNDVRRTLHTAWDSLHILGSSAIEQFLEKTIQVYEGGNILSYSGASRGWYNPSPYPLPDTGKKLWDYDLSLGWYTSARGSQRSQYNHPERLTSFFRMLEHAY